MNFSYRSLSDQLNLEYVLTGVYDTPSPELFANPETPKHCLFAHFDRWQHGNYTILTAADSGCRGGGRWLCSEIAMPHDKFLEFLTHTEGLKASTKLTDDWLSSVKSYKPEHGNIIIGPLAEHSFEFLKTVTFWVNPDQLSTLLIGAQYHNGAKNTTPVMAPFGSGCGQLLPLFDDYSQVRAMIGATDIAMRQHLPPEIMAFTVTLPMFERLCSLNDQSFLFKPFFNRLKGARGGQLN
jgi:hypothetical protein